MSSGSGLIIHCSQLSIKLDTHFKVKLEQLLTDKCARKCQQLLKLHSVMKFLITLTLNFYIFYFILTTIGLNSGINHSDHWSFLKGNIKAVTY